MDDSEFELEECSPKLSLRGKVFIFANVCFAALILYFYMAQLDLPDSGGARAAFELNTGIPASRVHDLHASISSHFNGDFIDLFGFSYTEPDFPEALGRALSLRRLAWRSTGGSPKWWSMDASNGEYYEDTDIEHSPVTQVWIDRQAKRCLIRLSDQ